MTPQELKNSILQLAIQGRLVEQRPEEGTGEALYQQIQAEKQVLIKAGKIKKEKPLPEITEDDVPFEIPESWKWCYVGDIFQHNTGKALNGSDKSGTPMTYITTSNLYWDRFELDKLKVMPFTDAEVDKCTVKKDDLLVCEGGDYGRAAIWPYEYPMRIQNHIHRLRAYGCVSVRYFYYIFYLFKNAGLIAGKGIAIQGLSANALHSLKIALPPLAEQKRIVAKIEELLPLIDRYEKAWSRLEDFNKRFPGDMQKSILQLAIQGRLVEQRPEEGTGEELYQQIQTEKQALIKAGKIKKEKPLPEITEDDVPFEIPESWKWVRVGKVFNLQAGKNITSADIFEEASSEHSYQCFGGNGCRGYVADYNRSGHFALIGRQGALCGNINYADGNFYATEHAVVVEQYAKTSVLWCGYFLKALNLNQYATATAQPGLAVANINQVLIPLPPVAEQKRIVAKLEELLPLYERLK